MTRKAYRPPSVVSSAPALLKVGLAEAFRAKFSDTDFRYGDVILEVAARDDEMRQLVESYVATDDRAVHARLLFRMGERWAEVAR